MSTFRFAIPASVCISFKADSEEDAIKQAKEWLIEVSEGLGVEYWGKDGDNTPDARVYFADDEDDISLQDEYDDEDSESIFDEEPANEGQANKTTESKYVTTVTVIDPDTGGEVELEVRKLENGGMVGIDGSFLEQEVGPVFSPFDRGMEIVIPDDETAHA